MRTIATCILGAVFGITQAMAADLPSRAAPPVFVPPAIATGWGGCYGGVFGGYDLAHVHDTSSDTTSNTTTITRTAPPTTTIVPAFDNGVVVVPARTVVTPGATTTSTITSAPTTTTSSYGKTLTGGDGGGRIGCNYELPQHLVIGGQIEGGYLGISGTTADPLRPTGFSSVSGGAYGAVSAKLGFALAEKTLIYIRGGVGYAGLGFSSGNALLGYNTSVRGSQAMPLGGVGIEYKLTPNVSVTGEYTYMRPGCRTASYTVPTPTTRVGSISIDTSNSGSVTSCVDKQMFSVGLNYYFNAEAPVVARY